MGLRDRQSDRDSNDGRISNDGTGFKDAGVSTLLGGDGDGAGTGSGLKRKLILGAIVVVGGLLGWLLGAAIIPRWWAQRIGDAVSGRLVTGSFLGLALGFVCTAVPLLVLRLGWRFRNGLRRAVIFAVVAAVVAAPNLATLGIVLGDGNAAHAGQRILDVEGPGFRGGTLIGSVAGAAAAFGILTLLASRRRNKSRADRLEDQLAGS